MIRTSAVARLAVAAIVLVALGRFLYSVRSNATTARRPNVILVSIDTLRPDRLGCYGHDRPTSPSIDAFREDSILFEQAIAHAPSTLPSHASILTSLLPHRHRASVARRRALPRRIVTLAEVLKAAGYRTASFNGHAQLAPMWGLTQGFEKYDSRRQDRFAERVDAAIAWMEKKRRQRFFLFLHTYETHHPYTPPRRHVDLLEKGYEGRLPAEILVDLLRRINDGKHEIDASDLAHIERAYEGEIRSVDEGFGRLVEYLRTAGLYRNTVILFTSDHGEEFAEHGIVGWHSHTLYDELLRVPLIVKLPDSRYRGTTVGEVVRGIDVAPTILAAIGLPAPPSFEGVDLLERLDGRSREPLVVLSQRDSLRDTGEITSLRTDEWKYWNGKLFALDGDPGERTDLAKEHAEVARRMEAQMLAILAERGVPEERPVEPDRDTLEQLRALGYVE